MGLLLGKNGTLADPIPDCPLYNKDGFHYAMYDCITSRHTDTPSAGAPLTDLTGNSRTATVGGTPSGSYGFQTDGFFGSGSVSLNTPFTLDALAAAGTAGEFFIWAVLRAPITPSGDANVRIAQSGTTPGITALLDATNDLSIQVRHSGSSGGALTRTVNTNEPTSGGTALPWSGRDTQDIFAAVAINLTANRIQGFIGRAGAFYVGVDNFLTKDGTTTVGGSGNIQFANKSVNVANTPIKLWGCSAYEPTGARANELFHEIRELHNTGSYAGNL